MMKTEGISGTFYGGNTDSYSVTGHNTSSQQKLDKGQGVEEENQVTISSEAMSLYQQNQERLQELYQKQEKDSLLEQLESQKEASDAQAESMKDLAKIMVIVRRISNGDKVPGSDEQKLMEYSSDLYQAAKAAALVNANKKAKEYDSVYDEDEENQQVEEDGSSTDSETAEEIAQIVESTGEAEVESGEA